MDTNSTTSVLIAMWVAIGLIGLGAGIGRRGMTWMVFVVLFAAIATYHSIEDTNKTIRQAVVPK